jgi:hypothetical protein
MRPSSRYGGGEPAVGIDGWTLAAALDLADLGLGDARVPGELLLAPVQEAPAFDELVDEAVLELQGAQVPDRGGSSRCGLGFDVVEETIEVPPRAPRSTSGCSGIRMNSVHPAMHRTPMTAQSPHNNDLGALHRTGEPHELAHLIVFLGSDESAFITGSELIHDGGETAGLAPR